MSGQSRKLHYKSIRDAATTHVGTPGDIWYDPTTTTLRFYSGSAGGTPLAAGGSAYTEVNYSASNGSSSDVIIDITKKYHFLTDLDGAFYTVADGTVDGQELVFVPDYHANPANIVLRFNSSKLYYDGDTRFNTSSFDVLPWSINDDQAAAQTQMFRTACRAVWLVDSSDIGAWHLDAGARDNR